MPNPVSPGDQPRLAGHLMGLMIAIPALIGWSYYNEKVETFRLKWRVSATEFLRKHYRMDDTMNEPEEVTRVKNPLSPMQFSSHKRKRARR